MLIYRLPDTVDRQGNTWAFWPWILSNRADVWERFATEEEAIERMNQMDDAPAKARKTPCASCPYRQDVPSGVWHESEYEKLEKYDGDIGDQMQHFPESCHAFSCHQGDGQLCSGWLGHRDPTELIAVRLGVSSGNLDPSVIDYTTDVPLFASGEEAAEHGRREIDAPSPKAQRTIEKVTKVRAIRGNPVSETP